MYMNDVVSSSSTIIQDVANISNLSRSAVSIRSRLPSSFLGRWRKLAHTCLEAWKFYSRINFDNKCHLLLVLSFLTFCLLVTKTSKHFYMLSPWFARDDLFKLGTDVGVPKKHKIHIILTMEIDHIKYLSTGKKCHHLQFPPFSIMNWLRKWLKLLQSS